MKKEYPMKFNSEYRVVTANDLITGHQKMTLRESQLLSIAISQVVAEDTDLKTYVTTVPELANFMGIDENSLYKDLKGICRSLCQRIVEVQKGSNKWEIYNWVDAASYDNGKLTLHLSERLKPFLLELENFYSQPMLGALMTFRSYYATRLYQYLLAVNGSKWNSIEEWSFSCEQLRELFQTTIKDPKGRVIKEQYKLNRNLINKTIKPALAELAASDYAYVYDYIEETEHIPGKRGKPALAGVRFKVILFEDDKRRTAAEKKAFFIEKTKPHVENIGGKNMTEFGSAAIANGKPQEPNGADEEYEQIEREHTQNRTDSMARP